MKREEIAPTVDERGWETHPAFATIGASRIQVGGADDGARLFDSEITHNHIIGLTIRSAIRQRDLNHDWIHGSAEIISVEMSEAQWASFVSTLNSGSGVPCTLRLHNGKINDGIVTPTFPFDSRMRLAIEETQEAADRSFAAIKDALAAYEAVVAAKGGAKERRDAMSRLSATINNATPDVDYTGKQLARLAEDVVQKAKADVEAFVVHKAQQLGMSHDELLSLSAEPSSPFALEAGGDDDG